MGRRGPGAMPGPPPATGEAVSGNVLVGISAWTEPTLVVAGTFYPRRTMSAEERLRFYASQFPVAEVDSTYYSPPSERNAELWIERTPPEFTFDVKAYALLTGHPTRVDSLYRDVREALPPDLAAKRTVYRERMPAELVDEVWERFRTALMPLHSAGKLGAVLFQFPQWFLPGAASRDHVLECAARLPDYRLAIEFRNRRWMDERGAERTLAFLSEHDLAYVCVDMPQGFESSVPPVAAATAGDLAVVRFHGRNTGAWEARSESAADRFDYEYAQAELEGWVPKVRALAAGARETHVIFNNCFRDHAVTNARQLARMLAA